MVKKRNCFLERIISNLDENLDNFGTSKTIEISTKTRKNANNSNHLTHASLNFELNSLAGNRFHEASQMINDYRNKEFSSKFFFFFDFILFILIFFTASHYVLPK